METRRNSPFSNNEDRMSKLPENLIHLILSFVDMKHVVQTSVLSSRWRDLWTFLPILNFDSSLLSRQGRKQMPRFMDFVNKALILRCSSDLQGFHLTSLDGESDKLPRNVNAWIVGALRRNVEELTFDINIDMSLQLPHCLFYSKSLTKLGLVMGGDEKSKVILPKSMYLPRLKSLELGYILIEDGNLTHKLFSSCPVLESLTITNSDIVTDDHMTINISSREPKHFELSKCGYLCSYGYRPNNITLYAPNLTSFVCDDYVSQDYSLENLSSLVTAEIDMRLDIEEGSDGEDGPRDYSVLSAEDKEVHANRMLKFLRTLHNVKELRLLSSGFLEVVSLDPDLLECHSPQFSNLQCLKLDMGLSRGCIRATTYLMKICPNIESLFLTITKDTGDGWEAGLILPCILSHLKFVEIRGVNGDVDELKFLEFLLKNSMVLEELVLYSSKSHSSDKVGHLRKFSKQLQTFSRSSIITTFVF